MRPLKLISVTLHLPLHAGKSVGTLPQVLAFADAEFSRRFEVLKPTLSEEGLYLEISRKDRPTAVEGVFIPVTNIKYVNYEVQTGPTEDAEAKPISVSATSGVTIKSPKKPSETPKTN